MGKYNGGPGSQLDLYNLYIDYMEGEISLESLKQQCGDIAPKLLGILNTRREQLEKMKTIGTSPENKDIQDLKGVYESLLLKLRSKFPIIPEDLTSKKVIIRYKDNGVYKNIILGSDALSVHLKSINIDNGISIIKHNGKRNGLANICVYDTLQDEEFNLFELERTINEIIENADNCEIKIEDLDRPRIPTKE